MSKNTHKYGFVYIWYDKRKKRFYLGSHWGSTDDGYICSSNWMRNAFRKRPNDFKRRILSIHTDRASMFDEEERLLQMIKEEELKGKRYYNACRHTFKHWSHDPEKMKSMSERISKRNKGTKVQFKDPEERRRKISETKQRKFRENIEKHGKPIVDTSPWKNNKGNREWQKAKYPQAQY